MDRVVWEGPKVRTKALGSETDQKEGLRGCSRLSQEEDTKWGDDEYRIHR